VGWPLIVPDLTPVMDSRPSQGFWCGGMPASGCDRIEPGVARLHQSARAAYRLGARWPPCYHCDSPITLRCSLVAQVIGPP